MILARSLSQDILAGSGLSLAALGLRFDRVALRVLDDLTRYAQGALPSGHAVLLTLSAPIRAPKKTVSALYQEIGLLASVGSGGEDVRVTLHENKVRLRLVDRSPSQTHKLIGFVHNPGGDTARLLDLAEAWLRR